MVKIATSLSFWYFKSFSHWLKRGFSWNITLFRLQVGTSSVVYPAAMYAPMLAHRGITVAEFNIEETPATNNFGYGLRNCIFHWHSESSYLCLLCVRSAGMLLKSSQHKTTMPEPLHTFSSTGFISKVLAAQPSLRLWRYIRQKVKRKGSHNKHAYLSFLCSVSSFVV